MNVTPLRSTTSSLDAAVEELEQALLEARRRVDVDLAGERDDAERLAAALAGDAELVAHCVLPLVEDGLGVGVEDGVFALIQSLHLRGVRCVGAELKIPGEGEQRRAGVAGADGHARPVEERRARPWASGR